MIAPEFGHVLAFLLGDDELRFVVDGNPVPEQGAVEDHRPDGRPGDGKERGPGRMEVGDGDGVFIPAMNGGVHDDLHGEPPFSFQLFPPVVHTQQVLGPKRGLVGPGAGVDEELPSPSHLPLLSRAAGR